MRRRRIDFRGFESRSSHTKIGPFKRWGAPDFRLEVRPREQMVQAITCIRLPEIDQRPISAPGLQIGEDESESRLRKPRKPFIGRMTERDPTGRSIHPWKHLKHAFAHSDGKDPKSLQSR